MGKKIGKREKQGKQAKIKLAVYNLENECESTV